MPILATASDSISADRLPTRWQSVLFEAKACLLQLSRAVRDRLDGRPNCHAPGRLLQDASVLAEFESPLWPVEEMDRVLVAGKIHNLRLAAKRLHGLEVPADKVFSFWRQLGRATAGRGFVLGRELREGCIVPAIGGGLCQLSNAIYDTAVRSGLMVVERHRHSRALPGSLAERDRDATVFWNYLDLRLQASFAWRLEIDLDQVTLRVRIRARTGTTALLPISVSSPGNGKLADCSTCAEDDCHRHVGLGVLNARRTWLVEESSPEFSEYFQTQRGRNDRVFGVLAEANAPTASRLLRFAGRVRSRWAIWRKQPIAKARSQQLQTMAGHLAQYLGPEDLHLVVSQGLLPYLFRAGELSGRRVDVLVNALPMAHIQQQLDFSANLHPDSTTLIDFRAPAWLIEAERDALSRAASWISPHQGVLDLAGAKAVALPWQQPRARHRPPDRQASPTTLAVLFPASALARKGVLELRRAIKDLPLRLLLPPGAMESPDLWKGLNVESVPSIDEGLLRADLVVLPAWVEHQPRGLLAAMALGIPVVATAACGLPSGGDWVRVEAGDVDGLRVAIVDQLRVYQEALTVG